MDAAAVVWAGPVFGEAVPTPLDTCQAYWLAPQLQRSTVPVKFEPSMLTGFL